MNQRKATFMPSTIKVLKELGENIRMARLRRKLSTEKVSQRAGMSRNTLYKIEMGSPSVAMGLYCQILFILGLEKDLLKVAADDILGRKMLDAGLNVKKRAPKKKNSKQNERHNN